MTYEAADGTCFDPVLCQRAGRYRVGPKGREVVFNRYADALAHLDCLPFYERRWRRPNAKGNWGIVRARRVR